MTKRYTGGVVSSSLPTVNAAGASGVFLLSQQSDYQSRNAWPPFKVEKSLRFRASALAYLSRTPAVASNQKTWTWSGWVKRSDVSTNDTRLFGAGSSNSNRTLIAIENYISVVGTNSGSNVLVLQTSAFYRDPSAWYHIVIACDTTQSTSSDRAKIYVNGVQVTAFGTATYPSQNTDLRINSTDAHVHGTRGTYSVDSNFDGYMAEVNFVDGQQLTPSSFGATDKDGNWSPIAYTGAYGTNGFYLNFKDSTSAATMGYDYSGNGNNWTLNGFNVSTANTSYDIMIDVPEDQSDGTANNRGNYCVLNPIQRYDTSSYAGTYSAGNLIFASGGIPTHAFGTMAIAPGNTDGWYWEGVCTSMDSARTYIGVLCPTDGPASVGAPYAYNTKGVLSRTGDYYQTLTNGASDAIYTSYTTNDVVMVAYKNGKLWFGKNGTWMNSGNPAADTGAVSTTLSTSKEWFPYFGYNSTWSTNFGQRPFAYAPPSGFKALNTFNLPEPTIKQPNKYFDVLTWTGNGASSRAITGLNFQPDFVWDKMRSDAYQHAIVDAVRGGNQVLHSNSTSAEDTNWGYGYVSSFNSNGFTIQAGSASSENWNLNGATFVAWNWNAGNSTVTNTSGSISAQVRANPTAGFSVVTYTSPNTVSDETVGHGLGAAPQFIITKNRDTSWNWDIWHKDLSSGYGLVFESGAEFSGRWSTTTPTSSVFTVKYNYEHVSTNKFVAYCFAPIAGYSAFGKYTGNGSTDGPFIYTGFRPRWILIKVISGGTGSWILYDTARNTYNVSQSILYPNLSNAEATTSSANLDILSNGFKLRTSNADFNGSGYTYIYSAFAEMPFKYARSR